MVTRNPAIVSLDDFTEGINMCIYADSGIGKTVFAGSDNTLFLALAIEGGTISAKRQGSKAKVWKISTWDELNDAYEWLEMNPDHGFDWVCIDSVTAMQKLCMRGILDAAVAENASRDLDIPALQDWQKYYNLFDRFITAFNDLPCNILYTATVMQNEDQDGESIVMPNLVGRGSGYSISQSFCASLGVVGYLEKTTAGKRDDAETSRRILFESMPPRFAKDRYDVLPRWFPVTQGEKQLNTLASLTKLIEGSGTKPVARTAPAATTRRRPPLRAAK